LNQSGHGIPHNGIPNALLNRFVKEKCNSEGILPFLLDLKPEAGSGGFHISLGALQQEQTVIIARGI
jgi:hypothetical protein